MSSLTKMYHVTDIARVIAAVAYARASAGQNAHEMRITVDVLTAVCVAFGIDPRDIELLLSKDSTGGSDKALAEHEWRQLRSGEG